ncbi:MAG: hypothetical protein V4689_07695 [Verrucomicrobiota bacterium]
MAFMQRGTLSEGIAALRKAQRIQGIDPIKANLGTSSGFAQTAGDRSFKPFLREPAKMLVFRAKMNANPAAFPKLLTSEMLSVFPLPWCIRGNRQEAHFKQKMMAMRLLITCQQSRATA